VREIVDDLQWLDHAEDVTTEIDAGGEEEVGETEASS